MKKKENPCVHASALRIALAISLLSICSIFLVASFAHGLAGRRDDGSKARPAITCTVTTTADSGPGTLRDCLASAADTIDATGVSGTIMLTSGELQVTHDVTINGPGAATLAVNGNATLRVFHIVASNVTISGLTITNGLGNNANNTDGGGGIFIESNAGLTMSNSTLNNNSASGVGSGGGISSSGMLAINNSIITGNSSPVYDGGGISNHGTVTISNSTISGNTSGRSGAGIYNTNS